MHHFHAIMSIILLFHESCPEKELSRQLLRGPLNNKIQGYAPHILKCLHEMQIIRFMHVCISLFHHQIKIYKQSGQEK